MTRVVMELNKRIYVYANNIMSSKVSGYLIKFDEKDERWWREKPNIQSSEENIKERKVVMRKLDKDTNFFMLCFGCV